MIDQVFTVTVRATSVAITPGTDAIELLQPLLNLLSFEDEFVEEIKIMGYMYEESSDTLYLHKGVDLGYIRRLLENINIKQDPYDKFNYMNFDYEEIMAPRNDEQVDVINFLSCEGRYKEYINKSQMFLVLGTGKGKTFCSCTAACKLHMKTLIITHRDSIRNQWGDTLLKMMGMSKREVCILGDGETLQDIANGDLQLDYDVYLLTHHTFRAALKRIGSIEGMRNITKNLGIGLKIIDEAHLEFRDTLVIDYAFNVYKNLYMTATYGRSAKEENSIFKYVFTNAVMYNPNNNTLKTNMPEKWVEYHMVEINTHVPPNLYRYRVISGRGMSTATYGKFVIKRDKQQTHFKVCEQLLRMIYEKDDKAKVLVFMPLIDLCSEAAYFFNKKLNYDDSFDFELNIKTINSNNTKSENQDNKKADVIVTTVSSCGTGTDIPGITDIICCSPVFSSLVTIQIFGRLRYCGKVCHYYDIWDASVPMDKIWMKNRKKTLIPLALNSKSLQWVDDNPSNENEGD